MDVSLGYSSSNPETIKNRLVLAMTRVKHLLAKQETGEITKLGTWWKEHCLPQRLTSLTAEGAPGQGPGCTRDASLVREPGRAPFPGRPLTALLLPCIPVPVPTRFPSDSGLLTPA